jgi:dTMP kinase
MSEPVYIAFEGAEGSGKSTQAARLAAALSATLTRETGGTPIGARLRDILHDVSVTSLDPRAEALMIAADRAQHAAEVVRPSLEAGRSVVSDRSVYSSLAYQGYGRGLDLAQLRLINEWALGGAWPDLVVLLDVSVAEMEARLAERQLDRFELEDRAFHTRVRAGFHAMASAEPQRFVVVDASRPIPEVTVEIRDTVKSRLGI